ncbi:MAG: hypothetical protein ACRENU_09175 [Gemmatimonadaceae bacterium]
MEPSKNTIVERFRLTTGARRGAAGLRVVGRGRSYEIIRTTQVDPYDKPLSPDGARVAAAAMAVKGDSFRGTARKAAKITVSRSKTEVFTDLKALIDSLPSESSMKNHTPKIKTAATSGRVVEEERNVRVKAWLYAASRENDNDFHLILGRKPGKPKLFMTMEVSGLPPKSSKHRIKIERARNAYKKQFKDKLPGSGYDFIKPPMPVEIAGSLFFDIGHLSGGRPGPKDLRKDIPTVWEVHPVTLMKFEP